MRMSSPGDLGLCQTSGVGEGVRPVLGQCCAPGQVSRGLRQELIDCWITVSNAGGAVGFPFPPVDTAIVSPVADELIASLSPDRRLLVAVAGGALSGWVHLQRHSNPVIAHWGLISHLQTLPTVQGQGIGGALMTHARQVARQDMGLEQLHLAVRGGTGLEPSMPGSAGGRSAAGRAHCGWHLATTATRSSWSYPRCDATDSRDSRQNRTILRAARRKKLRARTSPGASRSPCPAASGGGRLKIAILGAGGFHGRDRSRWRWLHWRSALRQ